MTFDNQRALERLEKLWRRGHCFDLMTDFFDRAERENNLAGMGSAYVAMVKIHKGDSKS